MINSFVFNDREVPLCINSDIDHKENVFSVIIGKNGVGKSRFISALSKSLIIKKEYEWGNYQSRFLNGSDDFSRVITVTTSPFDKFPLPQKPSSKKRILSNYRYIGMRGQTNTRPSVISLISSAALGLLESFSYENNENRLVEVFKMLGFFPELHLYFRESKELNLLLNYVNSSFGIDLDLFLSEYDDLASFKMSDNRTLLEMARSERMELVEAIHTFKNVFMGDKYLSINMNLFDKSFYTHDKKIKMHKEMAETLCVLLKNNLIHLVDLQLEKEFVGRFSLRRASSGEQCMLVMMLGIAGHITDNSYIFIDEPEISLHPSWQEKIIKLLMDVFSNYKHCHFFIATHSPQIVSKLDSDNCFVTSLENNYLYKAEDFFNRSSDYQLAELFGAPGYHNEYITRIAFTLLSNMKAKSEVNKDDELLLMKLKRLNNSLDKNDPVFKLIKSVEEVFNFYASN